MKFLLDESADSRLASYLTDRGHDVRIIARDYPQALSDQEVLSIAEREGRILITNDRDFGELIFRRGQPHSGVILFRLRTTALAAKRSRLDYVLTHYSERLTNFIVVTGPAGQDSPDKAVLRFQQKAWLQTMLKAAHVYRDGRIELEFRG